MVKKYLPFAVLTVLGLTSVASAAHDSGRMKNDNRPQNDRRGRGADDCAIRTPNDYDRKACCPAPEGPAPCYPDDCVECVRCLGPMNFAGNPPVCPKGCGGDYILDVAALYWNAHMDGLEYAISNNVTNPLTPGAASNNSDLNQLADARYLHPSSKWDWGFKLSLGYCNPCDGWDLGLEWTWFREKSHSHFDADSEDNVTILPLWSNFANFAPGNPFQPNLAATDAEARWKLKLNLVDLELGRKFWVSHYLAIRPFVGVRYASLNQTYNIEYNGGSFRANNLPQPAFNDFVDLKNDYRGAGLRGGLESEWNFGCGWAIYGKGAASIVYGRFHVDHDEFIRAALAPHAITSLVDADEHIRASRGMLDLELGIQWSTMFCNCEYQFVAMFGWEQHIFFDQNQLWRVNRVGSTGGGTAGPPVTPTLSGQNVFNQRRGDLDAQGWVLKFVFGF